jgi:hypothetical protein
LFPRLRTQHSFPTLKVPTLCAIMPQVPSDGSLRGLSTELGVVALVISSVSFALAMVAVGLRYWAKCIIKRPWADHDWLILASSVRWLYAHLEETLFFADNTIIRSLRRLIMQALSQVSPRWLQHVRILTRSLQRYISRGNWNAHTRCNPARTRPIGTRIQGNIPP